MENNTIERYIATITVGDECHKVGEEHKLAPWDIDRTKEIGLKLQIDENVWGDKYYHLYPCTIRKETYRLELINTEDVPGGDRMNVSYRKGEIAYDREDAPYDWKDHWC